MKKLFATFLLPLVFLSACSAEEVKTEPVVPDPMVKIMDLTKKPAYEITEIGTLKAGEETDLIAQSAGTISDVTAKLGDSVTANQALATIGADELNSPALITLENAKLQLEGAEKNLSSNKTNNQDGVLKAQLRVQTLATTLDKLNRNLSELQAQSTNASTSLDLQKNTLLQNSQLASTTSSNLQTQLQQSLDTLLSNGKNSLDAVFVNLDSNFARVDSILNPDDLNYLSPNDVNSGLGEQNYSELNDAVSLYNNYEGNIRQAKSNYQSNLPLSESNFEFTVFEARQRLDEIRLLLAEIREMLNASNSNDALPAQLLESYRGMISGAEAATLGDLMKLDTLSQALASFRVDQNNKIATSQTSQATLNNQLAEAENARQKLLLTSNGTMKDLQTQILQTQIDLKGAQNDLASAGRTAGILNNSKDLELSTLNNQVRLAENSLDKNKILSKTAGVISELTVSNGDYVTPGMRVGKVSQVEDVNVIFYLSEENAAKITVGQAFDFSLSTTGQKMPATVTKIAPAVDLQNKKIRVEGTAERTTLSLKPEASVQVHLDLSAGTFDENKVYIPLKAVIFGQNETRVYVIENDMATKRPVETGEIFGEWVEVLSGITNNDLLIVEGQRNLPPEGGVKVNYGQNPTSNEPVNDTIPNVPMTNDQSDSTNTVNPNSTDQNTTVPSSPVTTDLSKLPKLPGQGSTSQQITPEQLLEDGVPTGTSDTTLNDSGNADQSASEELYPLPTSTTR